MRITAGQFKGRTLSVPTFAGVRPTPAKVRQALFNILGNLDGWRVLDLFSGSGLMAIESLSRGAASVVSIEQNAKVCRTLEEVRRSWALTDSWRIVRNDVQAALGSLRNEKFDLVFADPPYNAGLSAALPGWLDAAAISTDLLVIEESSLTQPLWPAHWQADPRRYGDTTLHLLNREE